MQFVTKVLNAPNEGMS